MTKQIKRSITRFFKGFTLVELIIVIAIIAILSVTAFMTITKWIGESRDSRRLSDIGSIHRALNYNYVDQSTSEKYPLPDEVQTITGENGEILWQQGVFGTTATEETSTLTKTPEDPNGEKYEYSVTDDQETYEVYAKLENGEEISYLTDKAYAQPEKYIAKRGNYNGYIVGNTGSDYKLYNAPSIYLTTGAQLTSGTKEIYQEGEKEDIQVNITGTNISDLYNGSDVEDTLNTISKNYPEITDTTKAQEIVNSAGNSTESVDTSSSDDGGGGGITCGEDITVEKDGTTYTYKTKLMTGDINNDGVIDYKKCWIDGATPIAHSPGGCSGSYCNTYKLQGNGGINYFSTYDDTSCSSDGDCPSNDYRLYQWDAANNVCGELPGNWRLPTDSGENDDWGQLQKSLNCSWNGSDNCGWGGGINKKMGGLLSSVPGRRSPDGNYYFHGDRGFRWSSTDGGSNAYNRYLNDGKSDVSRISNDKGYGHSVVCLQE